MTPAEWAAVKSLFEEALARPEGERTEFVRGKEGADSGVAREVLSLLAAHKGAGEFLGAPTAPAVQGDAPRAPVPAALTAGVHVGPYEVLELLGAGGMGEVYRAHDERLRREVAIKVLPASFAQDTDRVRRFEREARAAAGLSHPNIMAIHDVGLHEGVPYLVAELLEGETLRSRLDKGPLPVRKAIDYAIQIARGLTAAHEKGIVHRDLKPANLFLAKDGRVKILDFGLAKATRPERPDAGGTSAPTALPETEAGMIMGTAGYMSPEQVLGQPVEARSDLFSLGSVLYEMLAGRRAFARNSPVETMSAILNDDPPELPSSGADIPPALTRIVFHCLEKNPDERFQSARDLAFALASLSVTSTSGPSSADSVAGRRPFAMPALVAAAAVVAAAGGLILGGRFLRTGSPPAPSLSLALSFPADAAPHTTNHNPLTLAPDGKTLVYAGFDNAGLKLFVRRLDRNEIKAIPGTESAMFPFISPDGLQVGFFADYKLKTVPLAGGSPITLCDAPDPRGGSWGRDGTIVFAPSPMSGLHRIPATGGKSLRITTVDSTKFEKHIFPQVLPDREHVLYDNVDGNRTSRAAVVSLRTGEQRILVDDAAFPRYLPTGHLVFTRPGALLAVPFSLKRLEISGPPVPLLDDLVTNFNFMRCAEFAISEEGTLVYVPTLQLHRTLVWVDRKGAVEQIPFPPGGYEEVALSPDGGRLAVTTIEMGERRALSIGDLARGTLRRSAAEGTYDSPTWAPDGKRVAFTFRPRKGVSGTFWQSADGGTAPERLTNETALQQETPYSFLPDGSVLLVGVVNYTDTSPANTGWDVFVLPLNGERKLLPFLQTPSWETHAEFSPDGRWVAYLSNDSERWEVFVLPFPGPGQRYQISTAGGWCPRWSRSGRELFYKDGDKMMVVDIETKPTFRASRPRTLFEGGYYDSNNGFDVAPDGTRFLMIKPDAAESGQTHVNVVLNWFDEVKRRVPGAK